MTWDPPGLWASVILSVAGGILAGLIVLAGEVAIRRGYERVQRGRAESAIGVFFKEWKTEINDAVDIPQQGTLPTIPRAAVQFAKHEHFLRRAPILIVRWSRNLTAEQVQELSNHLEGHQRSDIGILPAGKVLAQVQYDRFFNTAQGFDWLDF